MHSRLTVWGMATVGASLLVVSCGGGYLTPDLSHLTDFVEYNKDPFFNLSIPRSCPGVPAEMLNPKNTWTNKREYDRTAKKLVKMFQENFKQYTNFPEMIINAGPGGKINNTF